MIADARTEVRAGRAQGEAAAVVRRILSRRVDGFSRCRDLNGPAGSGRRRWRDVRPEIPPEAIKRLSGAMLCRGVSDPYYGNEKFRDDEARLIGAGVDARVSEFDGGHVWPHELNGILSRFVRDCFPDATAD